MRNITLCGVLLLIFCTCSNLYAQHIISRKLPFFYELASNEIFDIYQDKEGYYLWIGTTNGLARYDGYRLQSFCSDYKDLSLLTDNTISSIADNEQYVWIGTRKGLNLYDKHTCRVVPFPDERLLDKNINYMIDMAYTIFFDHSKIDNYPLEQLKEQMGWDVNILNLCMDKESLMWISQDRYGLCLYDLQRNLLVDNKNNEVSGLGEVELLVKSRAKDGIWVTPRYVPRAVRVAYRDMSVCVEEDINLSGQASGSIKNLTEDSAGNLWILTKSALFIKQPDVGGKNRSLGGKFFACKDFTPYIICLDACFCGVVCFFCILELMLIT